ncbi:MAG: hypothetical protein EOO75_17265 [Myxococcales bacterium]|nr:MAG: hypothetical protein EOO75_17265 [Myxococcales bacterium]
MKKRRPKGSAAREVDAAVDERTGAIEAQRRAFARARAWATWSSLGLVAGVALTATQGAVLGPLREIGSMLGPLVAVASIAAAIAAAHSLGRAGPDPELLDDDAHPDHR